MCCVVVFSCEGTACILANATKRSEQILMVHLQRSNRNRLHGRYVPKKLIKTVCPNGQTAKFSSGNGEGVPPVLIPNTEVKPFRADGTWLETTRESRSPLDSIYSSIAQLVERSAVNRNVVGSSPTWGARSPFKL